MRRNRILWVVLWGLSLVAITYYGGAISYGLFWGVSMVPVVALVYLVLVFFRFRIYQELETRNLVCKQPIPYYFVLNNGEKFAFAGISVRLFSTLSYVEDIADDRECELLPGEQQVYRTRLVCRYRGEYEVGVKDVVVTDCFRLFRMRYRLPSTIKALVYPRILRKDSLQTIADIAWQVARDAAHNANQPDIVVRDYQPGDARKQIHWKSTARQQQLKSRILTGEERRGVTMYLETRRSEREPAKYLALENQLLELLLALGFFWADRNTPFAVYMGQDATCPMQVNGLADYERFYEKIAHVMFQEQEEAGAGIRKLLHSGTLLGSQCFLGILQELTQEILVAAEELAAYGVCVALYVVTDENLEEYVRHGSERLRIIPISITADLEEVL